MGQVYPLHFDTPYKHARHYIGFSDDLDKRLLRQPRGNGARLMVVVHKAGITWRLARTWDGDRHLERFLHNQKNSPRLCPICQAASRKGEG
jgi:hypothetical protein